MLVCILCLKASLLCIRGSRKPWYKENEIKISDDFRLSVYDADLKIDDELKEMRDDEEPMGGEEWRIYWISKWYYLMFYMFKFIDLLIFLFLILG